MTFCVALCESYLSTSYLDNGSFQIFLEHLDILESLFGQLTAGLYYDGLGEEKKDLYKLLKNLNSNQNWITVLFRV
jgi:hypothetical protein